MKIVEKGNTLVITNITSRTEVQHIVKNVLPTKTKLIALQIFSPLGGDAFTVVDNKSAIDLSSVVAEMPSLRSLFLNVSSIPGSQHSVFDEALSRSNLLQYAIQRKYSYKKLA